MRKLTALSKLYGRPPTNADIERDFKRNIDFAWLALEELYDYLSACHQDGLLCSDIMSEERALEELDAVRNTLDRDLAWGFRLDLPELPKELTDLLRTA